MVGPLQKEAQVRESLSKEFGVKFRKRRLPLKTGKVWREFDAVSDDSRIVAEIKSDKHTEKGYPTTRFPRAMLACRYLELVEADKKLMIFTDRRFYERFRQDSDGLLLDDIEVRLIEVSYFSDEADLGSQDISV